MLLQQNCICYSCLTCIQSKTKSTDNLIYTSIGMEFEITCLYISNIFLAFLCVFVSSLFCKQQKIMQVWWLYLLHAHVKDNLLEGKQSFITYYTNCSYYFSQTGWVYKVTHSLYVDVKIKMSEKKVCKRWIPYSIVPAIDYYL